MQSKVELSGVPQGAPRSLLARSLTLAAFPRTRKGGGTCEVWVYTILKNQIQVLRGCLYWKLKGSLPKSDFEPQNLQP